MLPRSLAAPTTHRPARALLLGVAVVVATAACGGDDDANGTVGDVQPSPSDIAFSDGYFDALPVPSLADPISEVTETGDTMIRSWEVRGRRPSDVVAFYRTNLPAMGWIEVPPDTVVTGEDRAIASFTHDDLLLRVTAIPAPTLRPDEGSVDEAATQMSLELRRR